MDWQTLGLVAGGAAVLGGAGYAAHRIYQSENVCQTRKMLDAYRRNGFVVRRSRDNEGNRVWNVYYPHYRYNVATDTNMRNREYIGKVVRTGPPVTGTAWFYLVGSGPAYNTWTAKSPRAKLAIEIAEGVKKGSVRKQLEPINRP